ncbi:MAG: alkaline phosphatase family protein, partial [Thermoactinomyces sp.]
MTLLAIIVLLILVAVLLSKVPEKGQLEQQREMQETELLRQRKPVILIMIDSLMDPALNETIHSEQVPALSFLKKNGRYFPRVISSFPTMSV